MNQLSKFSPNLAEHTQPLRELLGKDRTWVWEDAQKLAFERVKKMLMASPVLALFDPNLETTLSVDASSYGLGAVLLQKQASGNLQPVAFISRSIYDSDGEKVCSDKKGSVSFHVGMRTSVRLPCGTQVSHTDGPQATRLAV